MVYGDVHKAFYEDRKQFYVIIGAQWGDEGKGKLVDWIVSIMANNDAKKVLVARFNGGSNAGHTIVRDDGVIFDVHLLPSGMVVPEVNCLLGNGTVVNLVALFKELNALKAKGVECTDRLWIDQRCHITLGIHRRLDGLSGGRIGTTAQGIGPTYSDKAGRQGIRMNDLLKDDWKERVKKVYQNYGWVGSKYPEAILEMGDLYNADVKLIEDNLAYLRSTIVGGAEFIRKGVSNGVCTIFEGANAQMLDIEYGTWPYVTSSNCTVNGVFMGTGFRGDEFYTKSHEIVGVLKAYCTRVGGGVLPTEDHGEAGAIMQSVGKEVGVTTGRKRRCGNLDLVQAKFSVRMNGFTAWNLTKSDILSEFDEIKVCIGYTIDGGVVTHYPVDEDDLAKAVPVYKTVPGWKGVKFTGFKSFDELPANFQAYINLIEEFTGVKVKYINTGAARDHLIVRLKH